MYILFDPATLFPVTYPKNILAKACQVLYIRIFAAVFFTELRLKTTQIPINRRLVNTVFTHMDYKAIKKHEPGLFLAAHKE